MQTSVPELMDLSTASRRRRCDLYGAEPGKARSPTTACWPGGWSSAASASCSSTTRGWDHHGGQRRHSTAPAALPQIDQAAAALMRDLKQRGLLDETLVIWGAKSPHADEQERGLDSSGRDHHPRAFTIWMAGGGFKPGSRWGEPTSSVTTSPEDPVHVHDLQATILHCLGASSTRS